MSDRNFDFARLIAPIATDSFFHNTWEKEPLLVARNDPNYYSGLFSMRDVGSVIYFTRPRFLGNRLRTTKMHTLAGVFADQERFFSAGENEVSALSDEYAQGRSIFVHGLEKRWQPVSELCRDLESTLRHPVGAMMFLTPKGSQGIEAHFDNVETFILQIEGSKHWRLYKPTVLLPLKEEYELTGEDEEPQLMQEIHLKAGDLLYFPRGHIHEAFTSDYSSLHITVGVSVLRWADLLSAALARLSKRDIRLREALRTSSSNLSRRT